jgi:hypothetical protein
MKSIKKTKIGLWIAGLAGAALVAGGLAMYGSENTRGWVQARVLKKEIGLQALDTKMHAQFPPGTPWAEVQRYFLENKIEHSQLVSAAEKKGEHKGWSKSYALFPNTGWEPKRRVDIAMELAFDEHSNLRDMRLKPMYADIR